MTRLLDREDEASRLDLAAREATAGRGRVVVIQGPPGVGKTRLLDHAVELARDTYGAAVCTARCGPLDAQLSGGLLRTVVHSLRHRDAVGDGAIALRDLPAASFVVAEAAAERPLVLALDDVHWADTASLRWLAHLVYRVPELALLLVLAARWGEAPAGDPAVAAILQSRPIVLHPRPLGPSAVQAWTAAALGDVPAAVGSAIHEMTGGSPLLVDQLLSDLAEGGGAGAVSADAVRAARPFALRELVTARLRASSPAEQRVAEAAAILGRDARLGVVARLAELAPAEVAAAASRLVAAHVLADGVPVGFAHPLVQAIVEEEIPAARRELLHRSAAHLLAEHGQVEEGGVHLLLVEPLPDAADARLLVDAGHRAAERHAYGEAAQLLARALADALEDGERETVRLAHARALAIAGEEAGLRALKELAEGARDPRAIAEIAAEAGHALSVTNHLADSTRAFATAAAAAETFDPVLHRRLLALQCLSGLALSQPPVGDILEAIAPPLPEDRAVLSLAAAVSAWTGAGAAQLSRLGLAALAAPRLDTATGLRWTLDCSFLTFALIWSERFAEAERMLDEIVASSRERGALIDLALASGYRAYADLQRGRLTRAAADVELARRVFAGLDTDSGVHGAFVLYVLTELGELASAEALLASHLSRFAEDHAGIVLFMHARGRLRAAQGRLEDARRDLLRVGEETAARGAEAAFLPWRADLARVLAALGQRERAIEMADAGVARARLFGAPGVIGRALTARSVARDGDPAALEEALALTDRAELPLVRVDALLHRGMYLRRAGRRTLAQESLREALDLASRLGARRLAELAGAELLAAGARPRRERLTGVESLTAAERRVAQLAAAGRTNRQIAGELFLTVRTVETHLTNCYRKLGLTDRGGLAGILASVAEAA